MAKELHIERTFDAPVVRIWRALTEPREVMKWWGPRGFSAPIVKMDFRVGGKYLYCMRASEEIAKAMGRQDFWSTGTYKEIVPMKKIVVVDSFSDEKGNVVSSAYYGMAGMPMETISTITLEEKGGKTQLTLRYPGVPEGQMLEQAAQGWNESFDKLAESLK
ncbi:MAG: SRPBCC domain-containing protein [Candidatus Micrarchaeota archaeon]|nr:SRPBCC domain-containing protein [Candidatus Micrarchaeota archaeon]